MMPELGKYEIEVLSSYAVSIGLLVALVVISVLRSHKARAALDAVEERSKRNG
ncbi:heme exporter protein CcmD [Thalassovita sp.]|uniref:heme exporter protein CcmD n=1 Tax=Thalassovita sp. TaxID=1979401 RepID=UPI002880E960|nr:heme exporter protein CcmD [Thalassovita sp.]MDF1801526.1 heme exporter protein CcmD [Thalassovita sp.]